MYLAHRLAWLCVYGENPKNQIDHIDGNRANNAIANLRVADQSENNQNQKKPRSNNKSGFLGVTYRKDMRKWRATIKAGGKQLTIGNYGSPEEAHAAYLSAKRSLHPYSSI